MVHREGGMRERPLAAAVAKQPGALLQALKGWRPGLGVIVVGCLKRQCGWCRGCRFAESTGGAVDSRGAAGGGDAAARGGERTR